MKEQLPVKENLQTQDSEEQWQGWAMEITKTSNKNAHTLRKLLFVSVTYNFVITFMILVLIMYFVTNFNFGVSDNVQNGDGVNYNVVGSESVDFGADN